MDQRLLDALQAHPRIHDWTVRRQHGHGVQVYLVGKMLESQRQIEREAYEVEIFNDHPVKGATMRGSVTIPLARSDLDRLDNVLDDAVTMAGLVDNPPWEVAGPGDYPDVELADPELADTAAMTAAAGAATERIREGAAAQQGSGVRLSAAELFLDRIEEEVRNSRGIEVFATATRVLVEATLLARNGEREAEYFQQATARRLADLQFEETVRRGGQLAAEKVRAETPGTRLGPVVVTGEAIGQLLGGSVVGAPGPYLTQTSASAAYAQISRFAVGEPVYLGRDRTGDPLTFRANAQHPFSLGSYRCDPDGVAAQDVLAIQDGVLVARPATQRYAAYLGIPVTGRPGTAEISPGATPRADLQAGDEPLYVVVAFSAPNVDPFSGEFGMEIRLGYEITRRGRRPIAGGSVSGNLFEAMAAAHFSSETVLQGEYFGPAAIRFDALQVSGEG